MTKTVFEVVVFAGARKESYWTLASSYDELAELLQDSQEYQDGASIIIQEADLASLNRLSPDKLQEMANSVDDLWAILNRVIAVCMPVLACKPPRSTFEAFYCSPKAKVSYEPRTASCN